MPRCPPRNIDWQWLNACAAANDEEFRFLFQKKEWIKRFWSQRLYVAAGVAYGKRWGALGTADNGTKRAQGSETVWHSPVKR